MKPERSTYCYLIHLIYFSKTSQVDYETDLLTSLHRENSQVALSMQADLLSFIIMNTKFKEIVWFYEQFLLSSYFSCIDQELYFLMFGKATAQF